MQKQLIACVKVGSKYGSEYVLKLNSMLQRHCNEPFDFICFTDQDVPGVSCMEPPVDLPGYWAKIGLFKLRRPLIYFDLDVVITGNLSRLVDWEGFGIIDDWWAPTFNSSVMKLTGEEGHVWDNFSERFIEMVPGDQDYITGQMPNAKTFPPEWFPSFKADKCEDAIPQDAMAVIFHGLPKPANCGGWVAEHWR